MSSPSGSSNYRCIGKGFCGSIWALDNDDKPSNDIPQAVIKREDGGPGRSVKNDYDMHVRFLHSARLHPPSMPLSMTQCHELILADNYSWWNARLPYFATGYSACRALITERIPRVPRSISNKLVDLVCADNEKVADFVKNNPGDDDCLIRPYLGRRFRYGQQGPSTSRFQRFSLRNAPLHIDQMRTLNLDVERYAETMAEALAILHWGAGIDANDVEFVLAPPRRKHAQEEGIFQSDFLGEHCVWILDFDCCREMTMDEAGVEQACKAFYRNDPYYPRPGSGEAAEEELWRVFKSRFVECTRGILGEEGREKWSLAEKLMEMIEEEGEERRIRREAEDHALAI